MASRSWVTDLHLFGFFARSAGDQDAMDEIGRAGRALMATAHTSLTNVIMTDEAILTVSSFSFRWCGLIARAYTRTLLGDVGYWSGPAVSTNEDRLYLLKRPELAFYWSRIFMSFAGTGSHVIVPYRPCRPEELYLMEQVAWAMEYFTVAHEYGHHILGHRSIDADPMEQEYEADRFALRICEKLVMEPFKGMENPYPRTGAGAALMLKALAILRSIDEDVDEKQLSDTHPPTEQRIQKIMNRHALQPCQLQIDRDFNGTVLRIMSAVGEFSKQFMDLGGRKLVREMKMLGRSTNVKMTVFRAESCRRAQRNDRNTRGPQPRPAMSA